MVDTFMMPIEITNSPMIECTIKIFGYLVIGKHIMKNTSRLVIILITLAMLQGTATANNARLLGRDSAAIYPNLGGRTIRVAVENDYPPFNSIDVSTGEAVGWDYDTVRQICLRLNCVPEFVQTAWDGILVGVVNGEFDVAADGITITEARDETLDFSIGYMTIEQSLLVRADDDRYETSQDLLDDPNVIIGTQRGTVNHDVAIEEFGEDHVRAYDLFPDAVDDLIDGLIDAVMFDNIVGVGYVRANADQVRIINPSFYTDSLGFVFPEGSDLVEPFNIALVNMMQSGTLDKITRRWFLPPLP
jgi:polar amino acid transport system substrate-binding protein